MVISATAVIPLSQAKTCLSERADQMKAEAKKIITQNSENHVAIIDAQQFDYYDQLERERIHLLLIDDASKGIADVAEGKVKEAHGALNNIKHRRVVKVSR